MPGCLVQGADPKQKIVKVNQRCEIDIMSMLQNLLQKIISIIAVEGTWEAWGAWSNCFQNNGTKNRDRVFTGGQPCNGDPGDTQNCPGKKGNSESFLSLLNLMV